MIFDPDDAVEPVRLWDFFEGDLVERDRTDPAAWRCDALNAFWKLTTDATLGPMLRVARDPEGTDLWLTPEEAERTAKEAALARIAELEAKLRERT